MQSIFVCYSGLLAEANSMEHHRFTAVQLHRKLYTSTLVGINTISVHASTEFWFRLN